jgi:hypothetical protein
VARVSTTAKPNNAAYDVSATAYNALVGDYVSQTDAVAQSIASAINFTNATVTKSGTALATTTTVSDHAALTTGVHGVGAGTIAKTADITHANLSGKAFVTVGSNAGCDYVTDGTADEVQLNTARAALEAAGGGTMFLPDALYTCAAPFILCGTDATDYDVPLTIVGGGGARTHRTVIKLGNNANCVLMKSHQNTGTCTEPHWSLTIRDIKFDGNQANNGTGSIIADIVAVWGLFENCSFENAKTIGFKLHAGNAGTNKAYDNRVVNCSFNNNQTIGFTAAANVNDGYLWMVNASGNQDHAVELNNAGNWHIKGGHIYSSETCQLHVYQSANCSVEDVTFEVCSAANAHHIRAEGSHDLLINNCIFYANADGAVTYDALNIDTCNRPIITNNRTVTGANKFRNFIRAYDVDEGLFANNQIRDATDSGFWGDTLLRCHIVGNMAVANGNFGFNLEENCDDNFITGNLTYNNTSGSIRINNANDNANTVIGNDLGGVAVTDNGTDTALTNANWLNV